ncbi:hypothetical protein SPHINGOAX6_70385 [Sphingomonas sp. AX6]|nr:hypothetical protein SPHINGOAX6_70385 [Sphingomonas sp. AX6]
MIDQKATRQLMLVRYYLTLADAQQRVGSDPAHFTAINLLHEALEATLIACSDHLNLDVSEKSTIENYLNKIDQSLDGVNTPYRTRILQFNRARVSAKHALTLPSSGDFESFALNVPEFIRSVILLVFGIELSSVYLFNNVSDDESKKYLIESHEYFSHG